LFVTQLAYAEEGSTPSLLLSFRQDYLMQFQYLCGSKSLNRIMVQLENPYTYFSEYSQGIIGSITLVIVLATNLVPNLECQRVTEKSLSGDFVSRDLYPKTYDQ
jgi:hypothetical protein